MDKDSLLSRISSKVLDIFDSTTHRYYIKKDEMTLIRNKNKIVEENNTKLKKKNKKLRENYNKLLEEYNEKQQTLELINASITDSNRQKLLYDIVQIEKKKANLISAKEKLSEEVNKLLFQKGMLENEILDLQDKRKEIFIADDSPISIEYIDNLLSGLEFEKTFAKILQLLGYHNIEVTSSSGDFGIDVLAKDNNDILYGFQCKLYSNTVGNDAIQQAYSGKKHYNCDIAIVVTNNTFTEQAIQQARETQVILWDRKVLINKLKIINKS